jgi:HEPN domain-containing protein
VRECRSPEDIATTFGNGLRVPARFFVNAQDNIERGWSKEAAFLLHQATERYYICFLLVTTLYFPRSHNIKFLRSLAEDKEPRLVDAWPRGSRRDRARFERLKRAYVEARYLRATRSPARTWRHWCRRPPN